MKFLYKIFKVSFFTFLDISGILLGVSLILFGFAILLDWKVIENLGWPVLIIGICAFLLHLGHYFNLKYMRWFFGSQYFIER